MNPKKFKKEIEISLLEWGFLPILMYMEELISEESYELADIIYKVIRDHNATYHSDIPTQYSEEAVDYFFEAMRSQGYTGEYSYPNMPNYVDQIRKNVEKLK